MIDFKTIFLQAQERLAPYISKNNLRAYRLLGRTIEMPASIDIYDAHAVIHIWEPISQSVLAELAKGLADALGVKSVFYKNRTKDVMQLPESPKTEFALTEYGNTFWINLSDYLDTGLFLDHRETRKWIGQQSSGKRVLNTFAYTGSFSVYAAQNGAALTHSVDLSRVYCDWIKKNFSLNKMNEKDHWVFKMDTFEYFKYAQRKALQFDIIVIDPPTFSRNKSSSFSVQKDHPKLISEAMKILAPKGFILFSNNYQDFRIERNKLPACTVKEKQDTTPPDFAGMTPHRCFVISK